ncbi:MAG: hypothetical protein RLZ84_638 [Actinomycetota bacterium]
MQNLVVKEAQLCCPCRVIDSDDENSFFESNWLCVIGNCFTDNCPPVTEDATDGRCVAAIQSTKCGIDSDIESPRFTFFVLCHDTTAPFAMVMMASGCASDGSAPAVVMMTCPGGM